MAQSRNSSIIKKQLWERQPVPLQNFKDNAEEAVNFYSNEVDKLHMANYLLNAQLTTSLQEKRELAERIFEMQKNQKNSSQEEKKKRHRRCASEIKREYICKVVKCGKSYGSQGSLSQHLKLKHPQIYDQQMKEEEQVKKKL